ncbi:hypothetical protein GTW66_11975 [Streptomyces sp. SID5473]|uniref:hypothetical protein n=2 Tax=Streptomyces TaxID=1883 RepID=UPI00102E9697|nr:hypothetical protein [Streptomyces tsukubensis]MYS64767.1 hypothetical protein [Streptomyces sp. SID5473]TAI43909.1 hypothetical protein EWI31_10195 [Streptomyces tsukubensis]
MKSGNSRGRRLRVLRGAVPAAALAGMLAAAPAHADGPGGPSAPSGKAAATGSVPAAAADADPAVPFAKVVPDSGAIHLTEPLTVEVEFHNTLSTPITDSFIVAVGLRLAPPAAALTPQQVKAEWYDSGASTWRTVELTQGATALSGFLTVDGGLPSVGSIPAKGVAKVRLRLTLDQAVPVGEKLQFVGQGLIQFFPGTEPVLLMDGKASYDVTAARPTPTPTPTSTGSGGPKPTPSQTLPVIPSGDPSDPSDPSDPAPSGDPSTTAPAAPGGGALPQTGGDTAREELAATGAPTLLLALGAAGTAGAGAALVRIRAGARGRTGGPARRGEHR